jgi:hypothetical protein
MLTFANEAYASNERSAYTWCEELPTGAVFMFDYSTMSPVRTTYNPKLRTIKYYLTGAHVAGFEKNELNPYSYSNANVVPVNVNVNNTYVYPIVSNSNTMVGLVWVTVEDGIATVNMRLREQVSSYRNEKFILRLYSNVDELVYDGMIYDFNVPFVAEENFFFEINGIVSYHAVIGSKKIKNCCAYYKLADYYRYDPVWQNYRINLMELIER